MNRTELEGVINVAWENRDEINSSTQGEIRKAVEQTLGAMDSGELRVAEKTDGKWVVNQWAKKAVLLSFRLNDMTTIAGGPGENTNWWDKVPSKFEGWGEAEFKTAGFRAVPGSIVRRSAYVAPGTVLMPSFVNLGAYVDTGVMSIPGQPLVPAHRSAKTFTFRVVRVSVACLSRFRPARSSSKTMPSSVHVRKSSKVSSSKKVP
eukprot:TRINITY_DN12450_c0_g1_i1.p1 TRINITY_DN12450_c0_g1~~TRINITY_DN12450_c0_g1_i1.p1  ORF type:complete len:205 (+),score=22.70 TRINITY_DN12450_c0_g1_i1:52-666(+)